MWPASQGEITLQCSRICEATCVKRRTFDCELKSCQHTPERCWRKPVQVWLANRPICLCV